MKLTKTSKSIIKWDVRFLTLAKTIATWSEDPSTQVGAVIVNDRNQIITTGYNGLPRGVQHLAERLQRPTKYSWIEHAERNAIYQAADLGASLKGCKLYCTLFPCTDCARAIIQSGIDTLVTYDFVDNARFHSWGDNWQIANEMLEEAGLTVHLI